MNLGLSLPWAAIAVGTTVGWLGGSGIYTFVYAKGASYLSNDSAVCVNCHIMREQFEGWTKSSHHAVAVCNDCHTPHDFIGKMLTKAINGFHHSRAFTTGHFHEPIQIGPRNREITQAACRHCHAHVVQIIDAIASPHGKDALDCLRCHPSVGHLH